MWKMLRSRVRKVARKYWYVLNDFKQELLLLQLIDNYTEEHCKTYVKRADRKHPKEYVISQVKNVSKKLQ